MVLPSSSQSAAARARSLDCFFAVRRERRKMPAKMMATRRNTSSAPIPVVVAVFVVATTGGENGDGGADEFDIVLPSADADPRPDERKAASPLQCHQTPSTDPHECCHCCCCEMKTFFACETHKDVSCGSRWSVPCVSIQLTLSHKDDVAGRYTLCVDSTDPFAKMTVFRVVVAGRYLVCRFN